ncbi:MAG: DUF2313 domain-containing protein [Candidatus Pacebacteria bacterium]|nr:DUF2313 domain-containing protein [Candidatus Paceibacterota bacterium]
MIAPLDLIKSANQLLPAGTALPRDPASRFQKLLVGLLAGMARINALIESLLDQYMPDSATDWLEDWERQLELSGGGSVAARRAAVLIKLGGNYLQTLDDYRTLAAKFDPRITVVDCQWADCTSPCNVPINAWPWPLVLVVTLPWAANDPQAMAVVSNLRGAAAAQVYLSFIYNGGV